MRVFNSKLLLTGAILFQICHAGAADLVTKNGKVFKNYEVVKSLGTAVQIRHAGGFSIMSLDELPDDLAIRYSPNLNVNGIIYEEYSVEKITWNKMKIKYKYGFTWIEHEKLPQFLQQKYAQEIEEKKQKHDQRMEERRKREAPRMAEREKAASAQLDAAKSADSAADKIKGAEKVISLYPDTSSGAKAKTLVKQWKKEYIQNRTAEAKSASSAKEAIKTLEEALKVAPETEYSAEARNLLDKYRGIYVRAEIERAKNAGSSKEGCAILEELLANFPMFSNSLTPYAEAKRLVAQYKQNAKGENLTAQNQSQSQSPSQSTQDEPEKSVSQSRLISYTSNSGGTRVCAECAGKKYVARKISGENRNIKCPVCEGTGSAGYSDQYLDSTGARHRSQAEQDISRAISGGLGGFGGGGANIYMGK